MINGFNVFLGHLHIETPKRFYILTFLFSRKSKKVTEITIPFSFIFIFTSKDMQTNKKKLNFYKMTWNLIFNLFKPVSCIIFRLKPMIQNCLFTFDGSFSFMSFGLIIGNKKGEN